VFSCCLARSFLDIGHAETTQVFGKGTTFNIGEHGRRIRTVKVGVSGRSQNDFALLRQELDWFLFSELQSKILRTLDTPKRLKYSVKVQPTPSSQRPTLNIQCSQRQFEVRRWTLDLSRSALETPSHHSTRHFSSREPFFVSHKRFPPRKAFSFRPRSIPFGSRVK
jgi:hypothetical protein